MKKAGFIIFCISAILFLSAGWQNANSGSRQTVSPSYVQPTPPDLTATVQFADIAERTNTKGAKCYSPRPVFTITKRGQSTASNFEYLIDWNNTPGHTWQMCTGMQNQNLPGGKTMTIDHNSPVMDNWWCEGDGSWQPGFRIRVDTKNAVSESNEGNNTAEKFYTPPIPKVEPQKTIEKDYQKAPVPKRSPMQRRY